MKKSLCSAILFFLLCGCYTPLNNSGVATTKPWLEVSGTRTGFDGKQYDSCYRFNIRFWPQEAAENIDLKDACVSACCWRADKEEITLDFNKNFEADLAINGRARKYSPSQITFKVSHSNLVNTTKVTTDPKGAVSNSGLVKLSYKDYENPARLAQIAQHARTLENSRQTALNAARKTSPAAPQKTTAPAAAKENSPDYTELAKALVHRTAGAKIDAYFYQMDKTYKKQGAVFLLSDRILRARTGASAGVYTVTCQAKARTGIDAQHLRASTFSCGTWDVNVMQNTVTPSDKRAQMIWGK